MQEPKHRCWGWVALGLLAYAAVGTAHAHARSLPQVGLPVLAASSGLAASHVPSRVIPALEQGAAPSPRAAVLKVAASVAAATVEEPRESVQADVSTRQVSITSSFKGTEIVVFGAVSKSRQPSAESGYYDVVIVVEGTATSLVSRRKSRVAGVWLNLQSLTFESVPSYYAIVSSRPLDEIANSLVLSENDIGFEQVRMTPVKGWETGITTADLEDFKGAIIRLKQKEQLYVRADYGVAFIGDSLFRASVDLPANVPVGPLVARVLLFHSGQLLSSYTARVTLTREGLERWLHDFAILTPLFYGIFTVAIAISVGLLGSALSRRARA